MFRFTPGAQLEPRELREPRQQVDPPAEAAGTAGRGAHPQVERRHGAERRLEPVQHVEQERRAERPVVLEPRAGRGTIWTWKGTRARTGRSPPLLVDGDHALAQPHLLLDQVLEQVAALRALVSRGEALALARDRSRHERSA